MMRTPQWTVTGLLGLLLAASTPSVALASGPAVLTNEADYTFARELSFSLEVEDPQAVADLVLHFTIGSDGPRNRRIPELDRGTTLQARHVETLARGQVPPASEITWWWTLTGGDGQVTQTAPQSLRYLDQRFTWRSTAGPDVRVWWYDAAESFATDLEGEAREALVDLEAVIGTRPERTIEIVTYQRPEDMLEALVDRGSTFESRLTTLGSRVAPDILLLLAGQGQRGLNEVLRHELAHIVLHLRLGKDYVQAPAWLDEGLAMYVEGPLAREEADHLARAMREDALLSLRSLTTFPGQADLVPLAYAQSQDVVAWLRETGGQVAFAKLLDALASGHQDADGALITAYGADQTALYEAYRAARGLPPPPTPDPERPRLARQERSALALWPILLFCCAPILSLLALAGLALFVWFLAGPRRGPPKVA